MTPFPAAGELWRVVERPELTQALEAAPVLKTESLGERARGVNVRERRMAPNDARSSWREFANGALTCSVFTRTT